MTQLHPILVKYWVDGINGAVYDATVTVPSTPMESYATFEIQVARYLRAVAIKTLDAIINFIVSHTGITQGIVTVSSPD